MHGSDHLANLLAKLALLARILASMFDETILVTQRFLPRFIALAFYVRLRQHLQFLDGANNGWLLERRRQRRRIYLFRKSQKVKPNIQAAFQLRQRFGEFRQFQDMELNVLRHRKMMAVFQKAKTKMVVRDLAEEEVIQKADRDRR